MNRKDFFRKLGIGALAVVVAPKILAEVKEDKPIEEFDDLTDYIEMRGFKAKNKISSTNFYECQIGDIHFYVKRMI